MPLAALPRDCRPYGRLVFNMNNDKYTARVDVLPNGKLVWVTGGRHSGHLAKSWLSVTGITLRRRQSVAR